MSLIKKIAEFIGTGSRPASNMLWIYVQCAACGEKLRAEVNLANDLSVAYADAEREDRFVCRKVLVGSRRCFRRIEVSLTFDSQRKLIEKEIWGGEFIAAEEYAGG